MKILYDHQTFTIQKFGGVSRYFAELFKSYQQMPQVQMTCAVRYSDNAYLQHCDGVSLRPIDIAAQDAWLGGMDFIGKNYLYTTKEWLGHHYRHTGKRLGWKILRAPLKEAKDLNRSYAEALLNAGDFDLFHPTYYDPYFLHHLGNKPFVMTIYDMIHEVFPEYFIFTVDRDISTQKKRLCEAATKIIAISEHTKNDLIRFFQIEPEKIEVIYLGNSLQCVKQQNELLSIREHLPEKYLLFTGNRLAYKNFYFFVRAIARILHDDKELKLVSAGKKFSSKEVLFLRGIGVEEQVIRFDADDAMLSALYRHAQAFVFPSLYEGFGLPVLEAFANGCPAILSNTSSLPEIGGDAALYFDPKNIDSIQETVMSVLEHHELRTTLTQRGYERIKLFSWDDTVQKTFAVYRAAIA